MAAKQDTGTFLEVEVKLDADPDFQLPDLSLLPAVARVADAAVESLEANYLDSADLRLTRSGTTLRRRTGGRDAGWHLKLPAGKNGRVEVRRAAGRSVRAVPPVLLGLAQARLRGAPVAPVARISTRRTVHQLVGDDGAVLAEVADDAVSAQAMDGEGTARGGAAGKGTAGEAAASEGPGGQVTVSSWRELEVELVEGDQALLDAAISALLEAGARPAASESKLQRALGHRLLATTGETGQGVDGGAGDGVAAAGAPSTKGKKGKGAKASKQATPTVGSVAVDHLRAQVAVLTGGDPKVRLDEPDAIHQMRVATRRLRSALATFRPLFTEGSPEPLRAELKWLAEVLGKARDAEVMLARLRKDVAAQPAEFVVGPVLRRVDLELRSEYRDAHQAVVATLDGERYFALLDALDAFVASPPFSERAAAPAVDEVPLLVRKSFRRVERAAKAVDAATGDAVDHDHPLHEVRKAAKRARYAAEAVEPVVGKPATKLAEALEAVQETLGDHQDSVVERRWLRDLGMRAHLSGENGWTFGRLHALAEARAQHDEEVFAEIWAAARKQVGRWPG